MAVKSLCAPMPPFPCCPGRAADMSKPITAIVTSNGDPHLIPDTDSVPYVNDLYVDSVKSSSPKPVANQIGEWSCLDNCQLTLSLVMKRSDPLLDLNAVFAFESQPIKGILFSKGSITRVIKWTVFAARFAFCTLVVLLEFHPIS